MKKSTFIATALFVASTSSAFAAPAFMSAEWAKGACDGWNASNTLSTELGGDWSGNNGGKGYKVIQMYNMSCSDAPTAELQISDKDGKAVCTYGGAVKSSDLDSSVDYVMYAKAKNWARMGSGKDGPMKAMGFGRLKFNGPKMEAMSVMGPFGAFLKLTGEVPGDLETCPSS